MKFRFWNLDPNVWQPKQFIGGEMSTSQYIGWQANFFLKLFSKGAIFFFKFSRALDDQFRFQEGIEMPWKNSHNSL